MATSLAPTADGTLPEDHPPQDGALASGSHSAESAGREQEEEEAEQEEDDDDDDDDEDEEEASDEDDAAFDASLAHAGSVSLSALYCLCASNARPPAMMRWLRCNDVALRCAAIDARSGRCQCLALCTPSACRSCCPPTCCLSLTACLALQAQSCQKHLHGLFEQNALLLDRCVC